jgi:quinoprotein glucose dehydrogenase
VTLDDAFDLTPELKAEAQAEMKKYRLGPIFTPPSLAGTLMRPGIVGGANWGGGALDPEVNILYVRSTNSPALAKLIENADSRYLMGPGGGTTFHNGIPLLKPPYAHLSAIDLNKGEIVWRVPFGDDPRLRAHPALKDVQLPEKLGASGNSGAIVTKGGVIFVGGGDTAIHAVDTRDGRDLWSFDLARRTSATPMTYRTPSGKQVVVIASGASRDCRLTAFSIE